MTSNQSRLKQVTNRAKKTRNRRVIKYVETDLKEKLDQAGPMAGIWLESLEAHFGSLRRKPDGLLKSFSKDDFDDLEKALFG
jgi:hypothetical protein